MDSDNLIQLLRANQINPTLQRLEIARFVLKKHQHISAENVHNALRCDENHVSKATIYNTLGLFVEKGLVKQVMVDSERIIYDSNTEDHYHSYNIDTGELIDIDVKNIQLNTNAFLPENTEVASVDFVVKIQNQIH